MNKDIKNILQKIYTDHHLQETDLDYSVVDKYKADLNKLSRLSNSCFFIVDLYKFAYIFTSDNFKSIFGYVPSNKQNNPSDGTFLDSKIHPEDFLEYEKIMFKVGEFILEKPQEKRVDYKHIFELRIQNIQKEYVRVSWERQVLETDKSGNLWLMLGILNILPDQNDTTGVRSSFINLKTGERFPFNLSEEPKSELTRRENEILRLIQHGLLSKEIAEKLSISINTVNVHRQNILQKMNVNNSLEAIDKARRMDILE